ncbi:MAG: hypothetical protein PHQ75_05820, partial [Thermoguttaceae bacterium]|nr:hypothetical protein [Thermoguttaceae bacterium]
MNIPYIRLYHNCIQISGLAAKYLESIVSFYESERILLIMNDPNGIYPLHRGMKVNTVAVHSQNLARYLLDKFGRSGCFCAEYRPITGMTDTSLVISEEPLDDVSLNIKDFTPIDFIPLSRHTCITLTKTSININNMGKLPYYGPIDILKRDDVFALVPNPNNFIKLIRNKNKNNDGVIFSGTLNTVLAETSSCFHWLWEENGILYFTANPKSRRRFLSTEGFIPISSRRERLLCQSTLSIHTCTNSLSVAWQDTESMKEHEYFSLFESGKFMALVPDPNGDYQRHYSHEPRGYHFYGKALCQYLLEKFQGA